MAQRNLMTIEEIKDHLMNPESWLVHDVAHIIDSIVDIRTKAYDSGWEDALAEFDL